MRPPRVLIHTLGCAKNSVDSDTLSGLLKQNGFELVTRESRADVIVVNTCGFIDDAKVESIQVMLEAVRWKQAANKRRVFAMGCLTQRDGAEIQQELPELDGIFGIGEWSAMLSALGANPLSVSGSDKCTMFSGKAGPGSAYLRISDGCSHACAFCAIPQMRGLYRSEPLEKLVAEAKLLARTGVKELLIIGQETTSYGVDTYRKRMLVELCQQLADIEGIEWLRILYAHPPSAPPHFLSELARVPKLVPYLDFPIEHASANMLKRMNRKTSAAKMKDSILAFRDGREDVCVRTTVLVGFPGETDQDFDELYRFMEDVRFERAGVFTYSPQSGTRGAELSDPVEEGVALDRLDRLMKLQKQLCLERHKSQIGSTMRVLIDRNARDASWGRSTWDAPDIDARVRVRGTLTPGLLHDVTISGAAAYQLDAVPIYDDSIKRGESCGNFALPVLSR
ncbi:MAG: 30S ribosomal protein S12 methylthiotransferase RimO [Calditrichaeota bacterium]|nr:30S ribosomal protein S12 methylthiotransferase RimO [Calditrichota bacterium]